MRLVLGGLILLGGYLYLKNHDQLYLILIAAGICLFLFLLKWHNRISQAKKLKEAMIEVNQNELLFLKEGLGPYDDGTKFINHSHPYSSDLDILGHKSMFHYLNRTGMHLGRTFLSQYLLEKKEGPEILANQIAIQELSQKLKWRQKAQALAQLESDNKTQYDRLIRWTEQPAQEISSILTIASYLMPAVVILAGALDIFMDYPILWEIFKYGFLINLALTGSILKMLKKEVAQTSDIKKILKTYSWLIAEIEDQSFKSSKLQALQNELKTEQTVASALIKNLSDHFGQLDNIQNPIGAILINGLSLFHVHSFRKLQAWKKNHAGQIDRWINVLGEFEALISLANFSYNNPSYIFPEVNQDFKIDFTDLGHPLISDAQRINNNINFNEQNFIILTGSNMSGKSTFLRSLGVNMVLANTGAPVCASAGNIHPLPILVSMRVADSLNDNESYFFAEVKRLKFLLEKSQEQRSLLLLDEILRGTNSNDKRSGTVAVIEKILEYRAIGAIATHDLKVCETSALHPDYLINRCFEVDIKNNELVFDYKLRKGICQNQSATFLMKKMNVI